MRHLLFQDCMTDGHAVKNWCALVRSPSFRSLVQETDVRISILVSTELKIRLNKEFHLDKIWGQIRVIDKKTQGLWRSTADRLKCALGLAGICREIKPTHVLIMYGDALLFFLPMLRLISPKFHLSCLIFRPIIHYRAKGYRYGKKAGDEKISWMPAFKNYLFLWFLRLGIVQTSAFQDEGAVEWYREKGYSANWFPAPPSEEAISPLPKSISPKTCFTIFGSIQERKGVIVALQAFAMLEKSMRRRVILRLVGKCPENELEKITAQVEKTRDSGVDVDFQNRFIGHNEIESVYASADAILTIYQGVLVPGSGVLVQAASYGRPVLATNVGWVEKMVLAYSLGLTVDTNDASSVRDGIVAFLEGKVPFQPDLASIFARRHTPNVFGSALIATINNQSFLPPKEAY